MQNTPGSNRNILIVRRVTLHNDGTYICQEEDEKISSDSYGILNVKSKLFKNLKHGH